MIFSVSPMFQRGSSSPRSQKLDLNPFWIFKKFPLVSPSWDLRWLQELLPAQILHFGSKGGFWILFTPSPARLITDMQLKKKNQNHSEKTPLNTLKTPSLPPCSHSMGEIPIFARVAEHSNGIFQDFLGWQKPQKCLGEVQS